MNTLLFKIYYTRVGSCVFEYVKNSLSKSVQIWLSILIWLFVGCTPSPSSKQKSTHKQSSKSVTSSPPKTLKTPKSESSTQSSISDLSTSNVCLDTHACKANGLCTPDQQKRCIATSKTLCQQSRFCIEQGACELKDQKCVVSDQGCQQSQECRIFGLCTHIDRRCRARSEAECRQSQECQDNQSCYLSNGECQKIEDYHPSCKKGCLVNQDGHCICLPIEKVSKRSHYPIKRTHQTCRGECQSSGRCVEQDQTCTATESLMCQWSDNCYKYGACYLEDGQCIRNQKGCSTSLLCHLFGRCSFKDGHCVAQTQDQCDQSKNCQDHRACFFDQKTLMCKTTPLPLSCEKPCRLQGKCTIQTVESKKGDLPIQRCVTRESQECKQAEVCKKYGQCTAINGRCIASRHQDCQHGIQCRLFGYCRASLGRCIR